MPGGVARTFIPTRDAELKGAFDEWLARIVCFAFSISPQGFLAQMNRATAETAQQTAISEGLAPIQSWVKQLVDHLLITEFDAPDLEFCWRDEREIDPQQAASVDTGAALALAAVFLIASHRFAWADGWVLDFRQTFPETRNSATRHCSEETHRLCRGELLLLWNNRYQAASIIASVAPGNIYLKFRFRDRYLFQGSQPFVHFRPDRVYSATLRCRATSC